MAIHKEHKEFYTVDLTSGWETPPGYPAGIQQQILAGTHTMFLCRVVDAESSGKASLVYAGGEFYDGSRLVAATP